MAQPAITNFFQKRKRLEGIDHITSAKVLVLEQNGSDHEPNFGKQGDGKLNASNQTIIYMPCSTETETGSKIDIKPLILAKNDTPKTKRPQSSTQSKRGMSSQSKKKTGTKNQMEKTEIIPDIRATFLKQTVKFELKGNLSPKKKNDQNSSIPYISTAITTPSAAKLMHIDQLNSKQGTLPADCHPQIRNDEAVNEPSNLVQLDIPSQSTSTSGAILSKPSCSNSGREEVSMKTINARKELGLMNPKRKDSELSLKEIKSRLTRSAKLDQLRESLAKINKGNDKLKDIEHRKSQLDVGIPKLGKFKTIAMEVRSPMKEAATASPQKSSSPLSSPIKAPAYQRFSSLATAGPPTLTLPFKHRCLAEMFRCVDTVVAMFYNRKEKITFGKLKPAVQQMLRKNFMENHLGQIKRVFPNAFAFQQEKCHTFGASSKSDKYELTIVPQIDKLIAQEESDGSSMLPSCLLQRRQTFTENLTERVKDVHEEFLRGLDPPMSIAREKLTRWHPEFDVDAVPDVDPDALPEPPNMEHYSTATDVLAKAKHIFSCNERMEKALLKVSELSVRNAANKVGSTTPTKPAVSTALRGIPMALLEKVRATQAAKAMVAMSRSAAEDRQGTQYSRLPEMARIVRNLYVAEKKGVLPLEVALQKIGNSFRENLPTAELEEHVHLMVSSVPGWLEIHEVRKTRFLKLSKTADMAKVKKRLEELAAEKNCV